MAAINNNIDIAVGTVVDVPFMEVAGLRRVPSVSFHVRGAHKQLWSTLDRTSCMLQGPPGSGKSTAVWFWLLQKVLQTGQSALWMHFQKTGGHKIVIISRSTSADTDGQYKLSFEKIFEAVPFSPNRTNLQYTATNIGVCVVDGVTRESMAVAGRSWSVFGLDVDEYANHHMIWVTSQQCVVGGEHLEQVSMERYRYFTWASDEIIRYAATFSLEEQTNFANDVIAGVPPGRLMPNATIDFSQALEIKLFYCGCSARWMYGMTMKNALEDIHTHIEAIDNAQLVQSGLSGSRSKVAVNHIIAVSESHDPELRGVFQIASSYIMEQLSGAVGMEAIKVMYSSRWVQNNPSVHGFVFEWDILTRLDKLKKLRLTDINGSGTTWTVAKTVRLAEFARTGMTEEKLVVCPEKWNHPEYDGLYIYRAAQGLQLVAWNASEATKHKGKVTKLLTMLEEFSQREEGAINFQSVRFVFLVPTEQVTSFRMPSKSELTAARKHLAAWPSFTEFEVFGTDRCTDI